MSRFAHCVLRACVRAVCLLYPAVVFGFLKSPSHTQTLPTRTHTQTRSTIAVVMCFSTKPDPDVSYDPTHGRTTTEIVFGVFNACSTVLFAWGERFGVLILI